MANDILAKMAVMISANNADFNKKIAQSEKSLNQFSKSAVKLGETLKTFVTVAAITKIGSDIIEVTSKFQKFEAVLTNTLGSKSLAKSALNDIKQFAATTPFQVDELTASFVKLANQGFTPTLAQMRSLGDLAASQGKSFDQLTEAIIDAQTGEFERLKEFGIRASKAGDQVKFTFKGVETQTKFTSDAIRDYILTLGDAQGVTGGMEAISKTLGGQISNMGDAFDALFVAIGEGTSGPLTFFITKTAEAVNAVANFIHEANKKPFADKFAEDLKNTIEEFKKLDKAARENKINEQVIEIQEAIGRLGRGQEKLKKLNEELVKTPFGSERRKMESDIKDLSIDIEFEKALVAALREEYGLMFDIYTKGIDESIQKANELAKVLKGIKFTPGTDGGNVNIPGEFLNQELVDQGISDKQLESLSEYADMLLFYQSAAKGAAQAQEELNLSLSKSSEDSDKAAAQLAQLAQISEQFASSAVQGQRQSVEALGEATLDIIDLYLKQSMAAAISGALKIGGPAGLALAGASIAAVRGLFKRATGRSSGGGGGAAASSGSGTRGTVSDRSTQNINVYGVIKGKDLFLISEKYANENKSTRT
jgi:hypothetical protein